MGVSHEQANNRLRRFYGNRNDVALNTIYVMDSIMAQWSLMVGVGNNVFWVPRGRRGRKTDADVEAWVTMRNEWFVSCARREWVCATLDGWRSFNEKIDSVHKLDDEDDDDDEEEPFPYEWVMGGKNDSLIV